MSRSIVESLNGFGVAVKDLAVDEILRGAPVVNVVQILAGITGAVAAGAIASHQDSAERIHALIDEHVAAGLSVGRRGGSKAS